MILVDSNILLRQVRTTDASFGKVATAVNSLHTSGELLCVVPQNVYEFWAVATRPIAANGTSAIDVALVRGKLLVEALLLLQESAVRCVSRATE